MHSKFVIIFLIFCVVSSSNGQLSYGASCSIESSGEVGICKFVHECSSVVQNIHNGQPYTRCGFMGHIEIVCCSQKSRLSEQKCLEYKRRNFLSGLTKRTLVVGGVNSELKEFPHMALVGFETNDGQIEWACGGSLISEQYILTAAHCIISRLGPPKLIRLGELDTRSDNEGAQPEDYEIEKIIPYPEYTSSSKYNDIALIKLNRIVQFNSYKRPACLITTFDAPETQFIATGWGTTSWTGPIASRLQKVKLQKFAHQECHNIYYPVRDRKFADGIIEETQLCAGSRTQAKDTCQGDSGGPLQVFRVPNQMYYIVGITSFGSVCGLIGVPGVYTRVYSYLDWIENEVWKDN